MQNFQYDWLRLLMPQYGRKVQIEDLNRNFWAISQVGAAIAETLYGDGPVNNMLSGCLQEITEQWENVLFLWNHTQSLKRLHVSEGILFIHMALPPRIDNSQYRYEGRCEFDNWCSFDDGFKILDNVDIEQKIIDRIDYLRKEYVGKALCVLPYIPFHNYQHNYYTTAYYYGFFFNTTEGWRIQRLVDDNNSPLIISLELNDQFANKIMAAKITEEEITYTYPFNSKIHSDNIDTFYGGLRVVPSIEISDDKKITGFLAIEDAIRKYIEPSSAQYILGRFDIQENGKYVYIDANNGDSSDTDEFEDKDFPFMRATKTKLNDLSFNSFYLGDIISWKNDSYQWQTGADLYNHKVYMLKLGGFFPAANGQVGDVIQQGESFFEGNTTTLYNAYKEGYNKMFCLQENTKNGKTYSTPFYGDITASYFDNFFIKSYEKTDEISYFRIGAKNRRPTDYYSDCPWNNYSETDGGIYAAFSKKDWYNDLNTHNIYLQYYQNDWSSYNYAKDVPPNQEMNFSFDNNCFSSPPIPHSVLHYGGSGWFGEGYFLEDNFKKELLIAAKNFLKSTNFLYMRPAFLCGVIGLTPTREQPEDINAKVLVKHKVNLITHMVQFIPHPNKLIKHSIVENEKRFLDKYAEYYDSLEAIEINGESGIIMSGESECGKIINCYPINCFDMDFSYINGNGYEMINDTTETFGNTSFSLTYNFDMETVKEQLLTSYSDQYVMPIHKEPDVSSEADFKGLLQYYDNENKEVSFASNVTINKGGYTQKGIGHIHKNSQSYQTKTDHTGLLFAKKDDIKVPIEIMNQNTKDREENSYRNAIGFLETSTYPIPSDQEEIEIEWNYKIKPYQFYGGALDFWTAHYQAGATFEDTPTLTSGTYQKVYI